MSVCRHETGFNPPPAIPTMLFVVVVVVVVVVVFKLVIAFKANKD